MIEKKCCVAQFITAIQDGGAETLVKDYLLLLDSNKFASVVVAVWDFGDCANLRTLKSKNKAIEYIYKHRNIVTLAINKFFGSIIVPIKLRSIIKKYDVDVIHIHLENLHYFKYLGLLRKKVKLFYTCHNLPSCFFTGKEQREEKVAKKLFARENLQMIALHQEMADELNGMFNVQTTKVIRNGIQSNRFVYSENLRRKMREELDIGESDFVIGNIGRLTAQKNQIFLIKVFDEIQKKRPDSKLILIGSGELEGEINQLVCEKQLLRKVIRLSHRNDIPDLMCAMDCFVFPSIFEGLGIVLIEAQAIGLRCVVSNAIPEEALVTDQCVVVNLDRPAEEWANIILDESIRGKKCSKSSLCDYDMDTVIKRLENLYLGV